MSIVTTNYNNTNLRILRFNNVSSTQDVAKALIKNDVSDILILADTQTNGRGRLNQRTWVSISGNFHGSFIFNMKKFGVLENETSILNNICMNVLKDFFETKIKCTCVKIKFPNDILIHDKKIAGILIEVVYPYVVIGIGVNTSKSPLETSTYVCISNNELGYFIYNGILKNMSDFKTL